MNRTIHRHPNGAGQPSPDLEVTLQDKRSHMAPSFQLGPYVNPLYRKGYVGVAGSWVELAGDAGSHLEDGWTIWELGAPTWRRAVPHWQADAPGRYSRAVFKALSNSQSRSIAFVLPFDRAMGNHFFSHRPL
jgi:hypothetical protein